MALKTTLLPGLATFTVALAAGFGSTFLFGDPTPVARGEPTQLASSTAARDLRGRDSDPPPSPVRVIDGDTLEDTNADITYRLVNIDTPATGSRARCDAERALGDRATAAVRTLVARARTLEMRPTGRLDRYGRTIAFVVIDGRDMGEILIAEGLARPWRGRREPWCDAGGNLIP